MPIRIAVRKAAGNMYGAPFVGRAEYPVAISVNISLLTTAEVDSDGFIKPGVPLTKAGVLVPNGTTPVFGVVPEAVRVAQSNSSADLTAAGTVDVTVITIGQVNLYIAQQNLGRVYTANELADFALAGCRIVLLS